MRGRYREFAAVTTTPTLRGLRELDPFHPYGVAKRLVEKPCLEHRNLSYHNSAGLIKQAFDGDLFMRCAMAEEEKFVRMEIGVPDHEVERAFYTEIERYYESQRRIVGDDSRAWKEQRRGVVEQMYRMCAKVFAKEVRLQLTEESRRHVLAKYSDAVWRLATTPPWRPQRPEGGDDDEDDEESASIPKTFPVMAGLWGEGDHRQGTPPTAFAMLDRAGQLVDVLPCGRLSGRIPRMNQSSEFTGDSTVPASVLPDVQRLERFIKEHRPSAIFIGGGATATRELAEYVREAVGFVGQRTGVYVGRNLFMIGDGGDPPSFMAFF